jgi:hypothetical protein
MKNLLAKHCPCTKGLKFLHAPAAVVSSIDVREVYERIVIYMRSLYNAVLIHGLHKRPICLLSWEDDMFNYGIIDPSIVRRS